MPKFNELSKRAQRKKAIKVQNAYASRSTKIPFVEALRVAQKQHDGVQ